MKFKKGDKVICVEGCVQMSKHLGEGSPKRFEIVKDKIYTVESVIDIGGVSFFIKLEEMNCCFCEMYFKRYLMEEDSVKNVLDLISDEL